MSSMVLDGVASRARSTDPVTSVDAGRSVRRAHSQQYVWEVLAVHGPFADHELVEFYEGDRAGQRVYGRFSPQRLRSARAELVEQGRVEYTGIDSLTPARRRARMWQVVRA